MSEQKVIWHVSVWLSALVFAWGFLGVIASRNSQDLVLMCIGAVAGLVVLVYSLPGGDEDDAREEQMRTLMMYVVINSFNNAIHETKVAELVRQSDLTGPKVIELLHQLQHRGLLKVTPLGDDWLVSPSIEPAVAYLRGSE